MKQELGFNAFGERVFIDARGDLKIVNAVTGKSVFAPKRKVPIVQQRAPSLVEQVATELKKHPGVVATVNEATGDVQAYLSPVSPHAASFRSVTPDERTQLEAERKSLLQSMPNLVWRDRVLAERRIKEIQRALDVGRFDDESQKRHEERRDERRRERGERA